MRIGKEIKQRQPFERPPAEAGVAGPTEASTRRKVTLAENVILTIKVLVGFALAGAALWAVDIWALAG